MVLPLTPFPPAPVSHQVGRELGRGSFGVVYAAEWRGTAVALKARKWDTSAQHGPFCLVVGGGCALSARRMPTCFSHTSLPTNPTLPSRSSAGLGPPSDSQCREEGLAATRSPSLARLHLPQVPGQPELSERQPEEEFVLRPKWGHGAHCASLARKSRGCLSRPRKKGPQATPPATHHSASC